MKYQDILRSHLAALYGESAGMLTWNALAEILERYRPRLPQQGRPTGERGRLTQRDALLITYGDMLRQPGIPPLRSLAEFCQEWLPGLISGVHLLPFYPSSSDDGFSVIDYRAVEPALGDWRDIQALGKRFRLMFDAVINHVSASSAWFKGYLEGDSRYREYFITVEGQPDLSRVVRPRALPLLTEFQTRYGPKQVWTTFSADQVDLNYRKPQVLLEIAETLLFYASQGAEFIRLDAIAYLWKEIGTACIHLPQTHRVIQLLRSLLDAVAPHVFLVSETNVPHAENLSYFGDGKNESQMVYNFALPPLVLHSLHSGRSAALSRWASGLRLPSDQVAFFNFLASHDGIGLNPARGLLSQAEIEALVQKTLAHGGLISYKHDPGGLQSAYELNINFFDALNDPQASEPIETQVERFMTAQAIMLSLAGVPGIYFHSLFGSRGWSEGVRLTGRNRTINRQKLDRATFEDELGNPSSLRSQVFSRFSRLLQARAAAGAFAPSSPQQVLECGEAIFGVLRGAGEGSIACLHNLSDRAQKLCLDALNRFAGRAGELTDLARGRPVHLTGGEIRLLPYQTLWLAIA